jgi:uncharacterized protein YecE (DUF72 family)
VRGVDVRLGLAGWAYDAWVGPFYAPGTPPARYLASYARAFRFAEVDGTYYRPPTREQADAWARGTPQGFVFSPKLPRRVVADKLLADAEDDVADFLGALAPLRAAGKLGPVLCQLPPSFRRAEHAPRLAAFLDAWPRDAPLAVELRHASWWREETYDLLRAAGASLVWSVTEHGRTPRVLTASDAYVRLVGDRALEDAGARWDRPQRDASAEIAFWIREIRERAAGADRTWCVMNNHLEGFAPGSARRLAEGLGVPPPDLAAAARDGRQRALTDW